MAQITKPATREIIEDFAAEIQSKSAPTAKPSKTIINFRTDYREKYERPVMMVPTELIRFRKDNGRIASDVLDHERRIGHLNEADAHDQDVLREFLERKDPERTVDLKATIRQGGQLHAAIITCDGFLINGNRRKMVLDALHKEEKPSDGRYKYMKVVILPGEGDEGGPPTLLEIEEIENRYQLQSEGKAEYYNFDRALSIKRKIDIGFELEEQLRDDPRLSAATSAEIKKEVKKYENDFLKPLDCIDRYLAQFGREGQYSTISSGAGDREGRWQAFLDYSKINEAKFKNKKQLVDHRIKEEEIGEIEEAAFNIIRLRHLPDLPKVHMVMRHLAKYCLAPEGKKNIKQIAREVQSNSKEDSHDDSGKALDRDGVDIKWEARNKQAILYHLKKAANQHDREAEKETPLTLLAAALKKLTHKEMDLSVIKHADMQKARGYSVKIQKVASELESEIFKHVKKLKKLTKQEK